MQKLVKHKIKNRVNEEKITILENALGKKLPTFYKSFIVKKS